MSDALPMPRRFWQIHLSTAIVLMLGAGGMMYVNAYPREDTPGSFKRYGWPLPFHREYVGQGYVDDGRPFTLVVMSDEDMKRFQNHWFRLEEPTFFKTRAGAVVVDVFVALSVVAALGIGAEVITRRRTLT